MERRLLTPLFILIVAGPGCRDAPLAVNVDSNMPPIAHAGDMQTLPYTGSPVTVTLDGSRSSDADGEVVEYRWSSGDGPDGGMVPDPDDVAQPKVTLGAGSWTFTLFVFDNDGGISQSSTVTIMVGSGASPEALACAEKALQTIAEDCSLCVCGVSDTCRMAIANCDQACWDFYTCVQNMCGEFVGKDQMALANCVRSSCSAFFGGVGGYMPLEPCINSGPCAQTCAASVSM